ncbi:Phospho-2-dehydro-3-deoxyheptonate aldolase (modular protein) [Azospirillaceae bacterium]
MRSTQQRTRTLDFDLSHGSGQSRTKLPPLVQTVKRAGRSIVWVCDPMHGNTIKACSGYKTRPFDQILAEVRGFFEVHKNRRNSRRRRPLRNDRTRRH